jgi:hypothetical protein
MSTPTGPGNPAENEQFGEQQLGGQQFGDQQYGGQQMPPMPGGGQQPYAQQPNVKQSNGFGIAALVLGILSIVLFFTSWLAIILGVLALVFGFLALSKVKKGQATSKGMPIAGIVTGVIGALVGAALLIFVVSLFGTDTGKCIQNANGDQAKAQQCLQQGK